MCWMSMGTKNGHTHVPNDDTRKSYDTMIPLNRLKWGFEGDALASEACCCYVCGSYDNPAHILMC